MIEKTVTVTNKAGLHARTAALLVARAGDFACDIRIAKDGREANARSIMGIMSLGITQGAEIIIKAEGEDAPEAVAALAAMVQTFGD
jgi:phosphotransferase system HPr (HPr) family protein